MLGFIVAGTIAGLIALYLVASPRFGERAYHYALFAPWKYPVGNYDGELGRSGKFEDVFFKAVDGKQLHGWYFQGSNNKTIIVNHGKTGNITDLERLMFYMLETNSSIFIYDYRGFGRSEGSPSLKVICEDGLAAYKWLVEAKQIAPQNIIAYGESLGGIVACHLAEKTDIGGLILQSAFCTLRQISIENMSVLRFFPQKLFPLFGNNIAAVTRFAKPILIVHGALDKDIRPHHAHNLHAAAQSARDLVVLPNTLHDEIDTQDKVAFVTAINSFLYHVDSTQKAPYSVNT